MSTAAERARSLRKRHQRERQAVVFGSIVAGLGVVGLGAAAVFTDVIPASFLDREFRTATPTGLDDALAPPCPPAGTLPVAYNAVTVNVLNASARAGIAGQTASGLTARGFVVGTTANATARTQAAEEIHFGETGLAAAYTLASNLTAPVLVLDTRPDGGVDLLLGDTFPGLVDAASVALDPGTPLVGVAGCVAIEQALKVAVPGPTPPPTTPAPAPADGTAPDANGDPAPAPDPATGTTG